MKISKIYLQTKEQFYELVKNSLSLSDIIKKLGLHASSGNYRILKRRLYDEKIDYSHIKLGPKHNAGRSFPLKSRALNEILIENSDYKNTNFLKRRLIKENILQNKCNKCKIGPQWNEEELVLQLDHINGNCRDNRLSNLRILCPNCHSQTPTYAAKNKSKKVLLKSIRKTKIQWPSNEELIKMLTISNYVQVGKLLGVSDNAIRKRLKISTTELT